MKHLTLFEDYNIDTAAVMIVNKNKVLILKRGEGAPWMPGYWNLPGGMIDPGETPEEAAIREAKEETNLEVENLKSIGTEKHSEGWIIEAFFTTSFEGDIKLSENEEYAWVSKEELNNYEFVPLVKEFIIKTI